MITDDERRRVAAALRRYVKTYACPTWRVLCGIVLGGDKLNTVRMIQTLDRLADLIDPGPAKAPTGSDTAPTSSHSNYGTQEVPTSQVPKYDATATCDMSQDCRDTVACDPTGRGVDSIYEWCRERLGGAGGVEDELYCAIMRAIEEYRHPELVTAHTVRAVDRGALLAVSEKMVNVANNMNYPVGMLRYMMRCDARRIREALGMAS